MAVPFYGLATVYFSGRRASPSRRGGNVSADFRESFAACVKRRRSAANENIEQFRQTNAANVTPPCAMPRQRVGRS
jgi:hypothetical protein